MMNKLPKFALFEDSLTQSDTKCFFDPVSEIKATDQESLLKAFDKLLKYQNQNLYLAGYISYEASYYLNDALQNLRSSDDGILLHFVAYKNINNEFVTPMHTSDSSIDLLVDNITYNDYSNKFTDIQNSLTNGESYQINYTKNISGRTNLSGLELYSLLKKEQPVSYGAYLPFGDIELISLSPELFFRKNMQNITVKPMKGTAALTDDNETNIKILNDLKNCPKNKSENLIIVDLLRNDMAGICNTHTVKVNNPFRIEKYKSLLQMTTEISGEIDVNTSFKEILNSLFPCGSITGAPKIRTMQIIKKLEDRNRHQYTGAIGYILPNNDMCFNVAIRTIQKQNDNLNIGVGGGITVASNSYQEWQEMHTKINFIKRIYKPSFSLVESIYYKNSFRNIDMHLDRLQQTADRLFFDIDIDNIATKLHHHTSSLTKDTEYKIRIEYGYNSDVKIDHIEINTQNTIPIKLTVCNQHIDARNQLLNFKTTDISTRGFYTNMHKKYIGNKKNNELLFLNEKGNITETRFHNIIVEIEGIKYTPNLSDGVLNGIARKLYIQNKIVLCKSLNLTDLKNANNIYLINSVRGLIPAYMEI